MGVMKGDPEYQKMYREMKSSPSLAEMIGDAVAVLLIYIMTVIALAIILSICIGKAILEEMLKRN